jgi:hypothetical protein
LDFSTTPREDGCVQRKWLVAPVVVLGALTLIPLIAQTASGIQFGMAMCAGGLEDTGVPSPDGRYTVRVRAIGCGATTDDTYSIVIDDTQARWGWLDSSYELMNMARYPSSLSVHWSSTSTDVEVVVGNTAPFMHIVHWHGVEATIHSREPS